MLEVLKPLKILRLWISKETINQISKPATWLSKAKWVVFSNFVLLFFFHLHQPDECISNICVTRHLAPFEPIGKFKLLISQVDAAVHVNYMKTKE